MKILFITFGLPFPPNSGARIRDFNLISRVAVQHEVSVLSLLESVGEKQHMQAMRTYCRHVDGIVADRGWMGTMGAAVSSLWRGQPVATAPYYYPQLAGLIRQLTQKHDFDIVQIEHSFLAPYREDLAPEFRGACVLSLHNIGVDQYRSMLDMSAGLARIPAWIKWLLMRGWEKRAARHFDLSIAVSEQDRRRLEILEDKLSPGHVKQPDLRIGLVENGVDCARFLPLPEPWREDCATGPENGGELIFVGTMGYLPNRDGVESFCRDILPIVRRRRPACRLTIVGSGGREFLSHLAQPGLVEITDRVENVTPFYQRAQVAVVPLRSGGGSRLKILEAMALGRPVVSTRLGCEGLALEDGKDVLIADDPELFARKILDLLADREHWRSLVHSARQTVAGRYDWNLIAQHLMSAYAAIRPNSDGAKPSPLRKQWAQESTPPRVSVIIPVHNAKNSLGRCLDALEASQMRDFELIVVDDQSTDGGETIAKQRCANFVRLETNSGAAAARNRAATMARSELLFFLDADVLVEPGTLGKILNVFADDPGVAATFCSYQSNTPAKSFASQYKNLLHHYTHQISGREAATFCGGYGAIRRDIFLQVGGFDESYRAMEDVELGYRLHQAGHRIVLSADIQLTHTKDYTLAGLVRADVLQRAIPWTKIMLQRRIFQRDLNLRANNLASVVTVFLMLLTPLLPGFAAAAGAGLLVLLLFLNRHFLAFLWQSRGMWFTLRAVPMIWLQYFYSGAGLALGILSFVKDELFNKSPAGSPAIK